MPNVKNLLSPLDHAAWNTWCAEGGKTSVFENGEVDGQPTLKISGIPGEKSIGKWICQLDGITGGATYGFTVEYAASNVGSELVGVSAVLTWMNAEGDALVRDYADKADKSDGRWTRLSRTLEIHPDVRAVKVELMSKWITGGTVEWRNPSLMETAPLPHRTINVATTYFKPRESQDENLSMMLDAIDEAAGKHADIICFTELLYTGDITGRKEELFETVSGRLVSAIADKARQHRMYAVINFGEIEHGDYYNTALLIGRGGEIAGKYRKTHLPLFECEAGILPGDDYPVFETDFGKIGMMICWDQWFPEVARALRLKGAEMIFVPTAGYAETLSRARAEENGVYLVIAGGTDGAMRSRIINPLGEITGGVMESEEGVYVECIDLDKKFYTFWLSVGPSFGEGASVYIKERRPDSYSAIDG